MRVIPTPLAGVMIIEPQVFADDRGFFYESYNAEHLAKQGILDNFVQDNHSLSRQGVLRGLHYQLPPHAQAKLARVVRGQVWDVAVDLRPNSPTLGQWFGLELSAENKKMFYLPAGCAHGFYVLSAEAEFLYKCSAYYAPQHDRSLAWNDPAIQIAWPILPGQTPLISAKDQAGLTWAQALAEINS